MLTEEQQAVVDYGYGPLVVLAGSGGGKTHTLVARILSILDKGEIPPQKIWVSTFTKDASNEIKERAVKNIGARAQLLQAGTLHSLCFSLYKKMASKFDPYYVEPSIIFEGEAISRIATFLRNNNYKFKNYNAVMSQISVWKNNLQTPLMVSKGLMPEELIASAIPHSAQSAYYHSYCFYEEYLRREKRVDFDDMLVLTHKMLSENKEALEFAKRKVSYIFLDEVQDNNLVQYEIVRLLTNNFTCVGDIRQALYSFRGANIENTHNFIKRTNAKVLNITYNFRSKSNIVESANKLIRNNIEGNIPQKPTHPIGDRITHYRTEGVMEEAELILHLVVDAIREGYKLSDIAILFRTNGQAFTLVQEFIYRGINYRCLATTSLLNRLEVRALLAYVRLIAIPEKVTFADVKTVINIPNRYIKTQSLTDIKRFEKKYNGFFNACVNADECKLPSDQVKNIQNFVQEILQARKSLDVTSSIEVVNFIMEKIGGGLYNHFSKEREDDATNDTLENLYTMSAITSRFTKIKQFTRLFTVDMKHSQDYGDDSITLQTVHGSKGTEYPYVIIAGASEGKMPHRNADSISEERRIFYVAVTRAQDKLSIVSQDYVQGNGHKVTPSRFINELVDVTHEMNYF